MKVVLFRGTIGLRLREYSEHIPKPMVPIGWRITLLDFAGAARWRRSFACRRATPSTWSA
jgi:hypothetical protein